MKKRPPGTILLRETNPLRNKHLVRLAWISTCITAGCGHKPAAETVPPIPLTAPLPTTGLSGQSVVMLPLTLVAIDDSLQWTLPDRRVTLTRADSVIGELLTARAPEISWVRASDVRRAAHRAPGIAPDPDQLGTAVLRVENLTTIPDPLRGQVRTLAALSGGGGGRYVFVPAALIFRLPPAKPGVPRAAGVHTGMAELSLVLADIRTGAIQWRTLATGEGDDPWTALTRAVKKLTPGLP